MIILKCIKLATLLIVLLIFGCASNSPPKYYSTYMCETAEWDYFYKIYEKSGSDSCTYSTRIHGGSMITEFWEMEASKCKSAVEKMSVSKKCCYVEKSKGYDTGKLRPCPTAMDSNPKMSF